MANVQSLPTPGQGLHSLLLFGSSIWFQHTSALEPDGVTEGERVQVVQKWGELVAGRTSIGSQFKFNFL